MKPRLKGAWGARGGGGGGGGGARATRAATDFACGSSYFSSTRGLPSPAIAYSARVLFADVDGDGATDRVDVDTSAITVWYWRAAGSAGLPSSTYATSDPQGSTPPVIQNVLFGDLDGAAGAEIVIVESNRVFALRAGANGALAVAGQVTADGGGFSPRVGVGHFRTRIQADLLVESTGGVLALYRLTGGSFVAGPALTGAASDLGRSSAGQPPLLATADIDGDGLDDFLYPVAGGIGAAHLGTRAAWDAFLTLPIDALGYRVLVAVDFDGDGRFDVAAVDTSFMLRTWLQKTSGALTAIGAVSIVAYDGTLDSGDVDGDGANDLVGRTFVARLVGGAWTVSGLNVFDLARGLGDLDGDGLLDLIGVRIADMTATVTIAPGVRVDLGIASASPPPPVLPGMEVKVPFTVTNNGHATAYGLEVAVVATPDATVRVTCPSGDCTSTVLAPTQSVVVTASLYVPAGDTTVHATVCGAYPDPVTANDAASVTLTTRPTADVSTLFTIDVRNASLTYGMEVDNAGPVSATNVSFDLHLPAEAFFGTWTSKPAGATCTSGAGLLSCALARLDPHASWTVTGAGRLPYHGQAFTGTADARSDVEDPNLSNNHYAIEIPALGVPLPGSGTAGAGGIAGCGCAAGRTDLGLARDVADGTAVLALLGVLCVAVAAGHRQPSRRAQSSPQRRPRST